MKFRLLMCCLWIFAILIAALLATAVVFIIDPSLADRAAQALGPGRLSTLVRILY